MNKLSKYILFLLFSALASCSSDDDAMSTSHPVVSHPGDALELTVSAHDFVTDGAPDTRATDKGAETTFENDDRVGIIILDNNERPLYNNIPYKYVSSSHTWIAADTEKGACYYDPQAYTYIVYYPYSVKADDCKSESDLKAIFKPQTDQRDKEAYRASDLMVNTITSDVPKTSLTASLTHAYASVSLSPIAQYILDDGAEPKNTCTSPSLKISDVNFTIGDAFYVPYQATDGSLRCILPAEFTTGNIRCFYTVGSKTYGNEINIATVDANTRYTSAPEINETYSLDDAKVGDFYCKNSKNEGYLIPGDVTLTNNQQTACIGIVYCTDIDRIGDGAKKVLNDKGVTPHGLVMALTDASDRCRWGNNVDENGNTGTGTFQNNTNTLKKQYNNVDGYAETHWILKTYEINGTTLQDSYSAFYHAKRYGAEGEASFQYAAPANTTGWFIPSMGQWWDILSYLGDIKLEEYQDNDEKDKIDIRSIGGTAINNVNRYLGKISSATKFGTVGSYYFWSSSECSSGSACRVCFIGANHLSLSYEDKSYSTSGVRCVFAF